MRGNPPSITHRIGVANKPYAQEHLASARDVHDKRSHAHRDLYVNL